MPPIITLQFNSFSYSSLHNNLNTLHTVLDLTIPLLYITTQYHAITIHHITSRHCTLPLLYDTKRYSTAHNLCFTTDYETRQNLAKATQYFHHSTSPLHYPSLRNMDITLPQPNITLQYLCFIICYYIVLNLFTLTLQ